MLEIIQSYGYVGIAISLFFEIAFMIFPLPGDTLLFAAGTMIHSGVFSFYGLFLSVFLVSVLSGHVGYFIGTKLNKDILINNRYYRVKIEHLDKTENFFNKYGFYAITISRFIPIVRNFISQSMGMMRYDKKKFFIGNLIASVIWPAVVISIGYAFGEIFPNLVKYAELFMVFVVLCLMLPVIAELWRYKKSRGK